jgi:hypothetical protein
MRFVDGFDLDGFDDETFYAATRRLEIISEASRRLTPAFKARFLLQTRHFGPDAVIAGGKHLTRGPHRSLTERDADVAQSADAALSEAASREVLVFEAAPSETRIRGFGPPTTMRCVPPRLRNAPALLRAPSFPLTQHELRIWRSSAPGTLPILTNRHSPSGALSPSRCRREPIPILPDQVLRQTLPNS